MHLWSPVFSVLHCAKFSHEIIRVRSFPSEALNFLRPTNFVRFLILIQALSKNLSPIDRERRDIDCSPTKVGPERYQQMSVVSIKQIRSPFRLSTSIRLSTDFLEYTFSFIPIPKHRICGRLDSPIRGNADIPASFDPFTKHSSASDPGTRTRVIMTFVRIKAQTRCLGVIHTRLDPSIHFCASFVQQLERVSEMQLYRSRALWQLPEIFFFIFIPLRRCEPRRGELLGMILQGLAFPLHC